MKSRVITNCGILSGVLLTTFLWSGLSYGQISGLAAHIAARESIVFIDNAGRQRVLVKDVRSGRTNLLTASAEGRFLDVKPSPSGHIIAIREQRLRYGVDAAAANFSEIRQGRTATTPGFEETTLRLLDWSGKERHRIQDVRDFSWSPAGDRIVVITGRYTGHDRPYRDLQTWVVETEGVARTKILDGGNFAYWAKHDENIYIWDTEASNGPRVIRYSVAASRIEATPHRSIYFSPSGKYYYRPVGVFGRPAIFRSTDDTEVSAESAGLRQASSFAPQGWSPNNDVLWLQTSQRSDGSTVKDVLYNVDTDVVDPASGRVLGWAGDGRHLVVQTENGPTLSEIPTRIVPY